MSDGILSGIAGAAQGLSTGMKAAEDSQTAGINQAVGLQNLQNSQAIGKEQALEQERLNKPEFLKDIMAKVPEGKREYAQSLLKPHIQGQGENAFVTTRDKERLKEQFNPLEAYQADSSEKAYWEKKLPQSEKMIKERFETKIQPALEKYKVLQAIRPPNKADYSSPDDYLKALTKYEKQSSEKQEMEASHKGGEYGKLMAEYDQEVKKYQSDRAQYAQTIARQTGMNESIKKIFEKHPGLDQNLYFESLINDEKGQKAKAQVQAYIKGDELKNETPEMLVHGSLREKLKREPTKTEILEEMQRQKVEQAKASRSIIQMDKEKGIDIPSLATAVSNGQDAPVAIRGSMGNPVATKVKSEILKKFPKFDFTMADANYKWKQSQTNMRTINFAQGSMQRVGALYEQLAQLKNTDIPAINAAMRQVSINLGKPEYTNFESNRNAIVQEVNTALSGSATSSDMRVKIELENLASARSPEQIKGAIKNLHEALMARLDVDLSPIYPIEVVRGEKTLAQYKKDLYKQYKGNYGESSDNTKKQSSDMDKFWK